MRVKKEQLNNNIIDYLTDTTRQQAIEQAKRISDRLKHDVMNAGKFPDKDVWNTEYTDVNGVPTPKPVKNRSLVTRIPIDFNSYAIKQKATLTCGAGVGIDTDKPLSKLYDRFYEVYDKLKLEFAFSELCEIQMNETHCAVIFYNDSKGNYKYKIVSPSRGDILIPIYEDDTDDMVGFSRKYRSLDDEYTDIYKMLEGGNVVIERYVNSTFKEAIKTPYEKLPIIYFEQSQHELEHTKELYAQWEIEVSRFFESCLYYSDPILYVKGSSVNLPTKSDRGQVIQSTGIDGDAKILTPDNATDMRNLQFGMIKELMHKLNFVAPIDFESLQGSGNIAASTLELLMIDAYMDASRRQNGDFGKSVQRMFNWLSHELNRQFFLGREEVSIKPKFRRYSLRGEAELVDMYLKANGNLPLVGHKESVEAVRLASDVSFTDNTTKE